MNTLEALKKTWITKLGGIEFYILPIGLVGSYLLASMDVISLPVGAGLTFAISLMSAMAYHICVYYTLKCPQCGKNLSKFNNGKNIPSKQLHNGFASGKPCRHCGWQPEYGTLAGR
ncbi:hypothetical protein [Pleionea mediterranea]|nr:hypothetical protein [Pleionea mediterranea]